MARNEEKAQSMLNRYLQMKKGDAGVPEKRPYLASLENDLGKAEKWRFQILKEISKKVQEIQVDTLPEYQLRELNDLINKLVREKNHWQRRIIELGGPNHFGQEARLFEETGQKVEDGRGYRYYGAARNLPGVKELLAPEPKGPAKRTRGELYKGIDSDYYGFRDDEDGVLERLERVLEKRERSKMRDEWNTAVKQRRKDKIAGDTRFWTEADEDDPKPIDATKASYAVVVPTQGDVQIALLERKKQDLLKRYIDAES